MPAREFFAAIRINWREPTGGIVVSGSRQGPNILAINRRYYSLPPAEHRFFAPYFAHPKFYKAGLHNTVRGLRDQKRNVRIFFSGTLSKSAYSDKFKFPILNRDKIMRHLVEKFEWAIEGDSGAVGVKPILVVSTSDTRDIVEKHKFRLKTYIDVMSRSDFFICPPGWLMPHSHNIIEAMSVGTIPITNYNSYMHPPLSPDANCLAFATLREFEGAIDRALRMDAQEVRRLRQGVISYYEEHLEPASFGKKLVTRQPLILEIVVNDESGR